MNKRYIIAGKDIDSDDRYVLGDEYFDDLELENSLANLEIGDVKNKEYQLWDTKTGNVFNIVADNDGKYECIYGRISLEVIGNDKNMMQNKIENANIDLIKEDYISHRLRTVNLMIFVTIVLLFIIKLLLNRGIYQ